MDSPIPASPATAERPDLETLRQMPFFADLGPEALADALRLGQMHRVPRHAILFRQDAEATSLHLLLRGRLRVTKSDAEGQEAVVRFVGPRELAGVFALLGAGQVYPATVSAVEDCVLLSWGPPALRSLLERHPQIALGAMRTLGARSRETHDRLHEAAAERVDTRLARTLLRLVRQSGVREADGSIGLNFPLTRQELAGMAGTTLHTASRILSGWEQAGILAGGRMRVTVRNYAALLRIAEG